MCVYTSVSSRMSLYSVFLYLYFGIYMFIHVHNYTIIYLCLYCIQLFATPWTASRQALLPMGFPRQEYRSGLPFPIPWDLPDPGIEPESLVSPALAGRFFFLITAPPQKPFVYMPISNPSLCISMVICLYLYLYFGKGNDNPLQYSCLENSLDRGAWRATVHGVARVRHDLRD